LNAGNPVAPIERQKKSLMERLTTAGFGRRAEGEVPSMPRQVNVEPTGYAQAPMGQPEPQQRYQQATPQAQHAPATQPRMFEDDQMEIPAFLRRQSN
jgi:cell division protein FtsZ